jgi:hypothetical protein
MTEHWVADYREPAASGLKLASIAASTDADRALQLLTNEFETVRRWSNSLLEARKSRSRAQHNIQMFTNALRAVSENRCMRTFSGADVGERSTFRTMLPATKP